MLKRIISILRKPPRKSFPKPAFTYRIFGVGDANNMAEDRKQCPKARSDYTTVADLVIAIFYNQPNLRGVAIGERLSEINIISEERLNEATREEIELLSPNRLLDNL